MLFLEVSAPSYFVGTGASTLLLFWFHPCAGIYQPLSVRSGDTSPHLSLRDRCFWVLDVVWVGFDLRYIIRSPTWEVWFCTTASELMLTDATFVHEIWIFGQSDCIYLSSASFVDLAYLYLLENSSCATW
jgi:hypothetical protein